MLLMCLLALTFRNGPNLWKHSDFWTMLSGIVDISHGHAAIQRDVDMLKKWVNGKVMRFNKTKANSKVLHLGGGNPEYQYRLGDEQIETSPTGKDLGILVEDKLEMSLQCTFTQLNNGSRGESLIFFFPQQTFSLHMHFIEHHLARQSGKSFLFG